MTDQTHQLPIGIGEEGLREVTDPLVTADDVAKKLSCTGRYVRKMAAEGIISSHKIGGKLVRFDLATVLDELGVEKKKGGKQ